MTYLQGQRINETVSTTIVVGLEALELSGLLAVRSRDGLTGCIAWETIQASVHQEGLQPILRWQELDVETSLTGKLLRHGLIQVDGYLHSLAFRRDHHTTVEVVVIVAQTHFDTAVLTVHPAVRHLRHKIPLLRCVIQPDSTALYGSDTMMNDFDT